MEWKEAFELLFSLVKWLLGLVGAFALTKLSSIKTEYDTLRANVKILMKEREEVLARRERGQDRRDAARADAIDFFYMDEQRRGERRREWPK